MSALTPTPKVASGGIAGAAVVVLVWVLALFGIEVPVEVAVAIVAIAGFVVAYLVPDASSPGKDEGV